jgi:hypothetical protein
VIEKPLQRYRFHSNENFVSLFQPNYFPSIDIDTTAEIKRVIMTRKDAEKAAQNRVRWRDVIDGLCSTRGEGPKAIPNVSLLSVRGRVSFSGLHCKKKKPKQTNSTFTEFLLDLD